MDWTGEIARGWDLFQLGAFAEAEALLSSRVADPRVLHVLLWVALRRGSVEAKLEYGSRLAACDNRNLAAVGRAHENVARSALRNPLLPWLDSPSRWARAEVAYARALIAFTVDEPDRVRSELSAALPHTAEQRVRYAQLRSWISGLGEGFERQASHLMHALTLALSENVDRGLVARIAAALAPLVQEVELRELSERAEALLRSVVWPTERSTHEFYAHRALAWRSALHGEWIEALQLLDAALAAAPDAMRKGLIFADRARISLAAHEIVGARSACESAFKNFFEIDWDRANRDEPMGLYAAIDVLSTDRIRAMELYARASATKVSPMIGAAHGKRLSAFQSLALSRLSDDADAAQHTAEAYKLFKQMKYVHRAADCALRAMELGGGARWRSRAERLLAAYPRSLGACRLQKLTAPAARMSGRMVEVAQLLTTTRMTVREIGSQLGIAEGTVRVHIKRINKLLKTSSRSDLVRYFHDNGSAA